MVAPSSYICGNNKNDLFSSMSRARLESFLEKKFIMAFAAPAEEVVTVIFQKKCCHSQSRLAVVALRSSACLGNLCT